MSQLGVYFKELTPKVNVSTANSVSFIIFDPTVGRDLRVGLSEIQDYLQNNLLFNQDGKQVYDLEEATKAGNAYTAFSALVNVYRTDDIYIVKPDVANTNPSTFKIGSLATLPLLKMSDDDVKELEPGDFKNTSVILYRTDHFLLFSSNGNEEKVLETITAGETLIPGNLITPSNDGKWYKADCFTESKIKGNVCYVTQSILINEKGSVTRIGQVVTSGLTPGGIYYVGVGGNLSLNGVPVGEPVFSKRIGTAISTTLLDFNPSQDYTELTTISGSVAEFTDAPADGLYYARKDNTWVNVEEIILLNALMY